MAKKDEGGRSKRAASAEQSDLLEQVTGEMSSQTEPPSGSNQSNSAHADNSPNEARAPMAPRSSKAQASEHAERENKIDSSNAGETDSLSQAPARPITSVKIDRNRPDGSLEDLSTSVRGAIAFFVVAALGVTFIIIGKGLQLNRAFVVSVPVLLMGGYALSMFAVKSLRLRDDQAGDNLYYLGFLFTLSSIGVSLYQFTGAASADEIVNNFGIAVSSTIAGLMLRIAINQMRSDPAQVERVARHELSEAARKLRQELETVTSEMAALGRTTNQKTRDILDVQVELVNAIRDLITKTVTAKDEDPQQIAKKMLDQLDAIHQTLRNARDGAKESIRDSTKHLADALTPKLDDLGQGMGAAIAELNERLSESLRLQEEYAGVVGTLGSELAQSNQIQNEILRALSGQNYRNRKRRGFFRSLFGRRDG